MSPEEALAQLRDIHPPPPPDWWPPAFGWWLFAAALLAAALVAARRWQRHRRRLRCPAWTALRELERRRNELFAGGDAQAAVRAVSRLIRRTAISLEPRARIAALGGDAYLAWLDQRMDGAPFAAGPGRALLDAPYRPRADADVQALFDVCEDWLEEVVAEAVG